MVHTFGEKPDKIYQYYMDNTNGCESVTSDVDRGSDFANDKCFTCLVVAPNEATAIMRGRRILSTYIGDTKVGELVYAWYLTSKGNKND